MVVWFYIALHYVDAVLSESGYRRIDSHSHRLALLANTDATREIHTAFIRLYGESKEARYYGTQYNVRDLREIEVLYVKVR